MSGQLPDGSWLELICDLCGCLFDGFHELNDDGDRCCPDCADRSSPDHTEPL